MKNNTFSPKNKDRNKFIRGTIQGIILLALMVIIIRAIFIFTVYEPFNSTQLSENEDNGFIAVSYFGVDNKGDDTLINTERLEEHLKALKDNGYVTITQKDITDYYQNGKKLPEKALFILFEDGRRDTAIFSQKILEEYNLKATMLTYADKFEKEDSKFLTNKQILELIDTSYWELGSNGYRLAYINVFDKNSNYLGELKAVEFSKLSSEINRNYNHYLMDYIRDQHNISMESYEEMKNRINKDYEDLSSIYLEKVGYIPNLYALMHSNTGQFGTNDKTSEVNEESIKDLFSINFNREGYSLNSVESSIFDLTRIQPQSYWSTNHLLMRIGDDTKNNMDFVVGHEDKAKSFKEIEGKAEFKDNTIILTSMPKGLGTLKLLNSDEYKDFKVSTTLSGNVIGSQSIYLRSNDDKTNSICFQLINNKVNIIERSGIGKETIFSLDLNEYEGIAYEVERDIREQGNRKIDISLIGNKISVDIDDNNIINDLEVMNNEKGSIYLESSWGEYGYSQRNIVDDVYDGVFKNFKIYDVNNEVLYDNSLKGINSVIYNTKTLFNNIIGWFIKYL